MLWIALAAAALLWPSRVAGPLDGIPLDARADALIIGLLLPALIAMDIRVTRRTVVRGAIVALLACKALLATVTVSDGWCLRFTSPVPLFVGDVRVPHAWDVRADWRTDPPRCSAIMTRGYESAGEWPTWFFNLPPANWQHPAKETERPPYASIAIDVSGVLTAPTGGAFSVEVSDDINLGGTVDGVAVASDALKRGVPLSAGPHDVVLAGTMSGERWRLVPLWNGEPVFASALATVARPASADAWLHPVAMWIQASLVMLLVVSVGVHVARRAGDLRVIGIAMLEIVVAMLTKGVTVAMRALPIALSINAFIQTPRRLRNVFGAQLLIGMPFLALIAVIGAGQIGRTTWYTIGDDWWLFQRFAYRIYLQGYWLEGGETAFWFQPFYRWIAGALHVVFGDSSVGELFWDGACAWSGALFAFYVTKVVAGFRWGVVAAVATLLMFTAGPAWYLFGRGLAEITSAGLIYAAALLVLRGRRGRWPLLIAGLCLAIAFYARLNNLAFAVAIAAFSLPTRVQVGDWARWRDWMPRVSRRSFVAVAIALTIAIALFAMRGYYFTGSLNPLEGTQASARSIWQTSAEGLTPAQNLTRSVLMVISMSDPPRWEPRAIPLIMGIGCALLGLAGLRPFRLLPLNAVVLCVAGMAGAFVAQGSAYPGRFSVHLVPVTVALAISSIALWRRSAAA